MKNKELKRLNIELSAHCSYACVGCPNTYMDRKKGHMSFEAFKQIYDEIENKIQKVFLWNYGEPLLNPELQKIILYTRDKKPKTVLSTTGQTLDTMSNVSFFGFLDELIISINGFDTETYSFHQKNGIFTKVIEQLEKIKPVMTSSETQYVLQTVLNSNNIRQIDEAKQFAKEYGFKKIIFKSFNVMDGKKGTELLFVPKEAKFSRKSYVHEPNKNYPCLEWMVINWNGAVNICCWDYTGEIIIGNVLEQGVMGVWESKQMKSLKQNLSDKKVLSYCGQCTVKTTVDELVIK